MKNDFFDKLYALNGPWKQKYVILTTGIKLFRKILFYFSLTTTNIQDLILFFNLFLKFYFSMRASLKPLNFT